MHPTNSNTIPVRPMPGARLAAMTRLVINSSLLVLLSYLILLGYARFHGTPQPPASDFGEPLTVAMAKPIVFAYIQANFHDPDHVKDVQVTGVTKEKVYRGMVNGGGYASGYGITFACNAKSLIGAYKGQQSQQIFVRNGQVFSRRASLDDSWSPYIVYAP